MFDKKTLDEWQKDIQGKSGLEAPVLGYIQCPLCKVCKNFGEQRGIQNVRYMAILRINTSMVVHMTVRIS